VVAMIVTPYLSLKAPRALVFAVLIQHLRSPSL